MRYVTAAEHAGDYRLVVTFDDARRFLVDLAPHLTGAVFEPLRDPAVFASFRVDPELDTVVWPNGADLAPEFLLAIGHPLEGEHALGG